VRSRIARFGGASFVVAHAIVRADGTTLAQGSESRVWGRHTSGPGTPLKGEQIPQQVRELFRAR
jgi:acyl-CoA thioesterase FadM